MVEMIEAIKQEREDGTAENRDGPGAKELGVHEEETTSRGKAKKRRRKQSVSDPQWKRACVDCTRRCARVHGRAVSSCSDKAPPPATLPSFFKVMMGHFSENMDIPPPFAKTIADLADSNVYLEDAFGLRWRVRLCCLRDDSRRLSFGHGWKNFVLDHAVAVGEFLVFRHIARSVFAVQIFAKSACERLYLCKKNQRQSRKRKPKEKTSSVGDGTVKVSKKSGGDKCKRSKKKQRNSELLDGDQDIILDDQDHVPDANTETENGEGSSFLTGAEPRTPLAMMDREEEIMVTDDIFLTADAYEFGTDFCHPDQEAFSVEMGVEHLGVAHGQAPSFSCADMGSWNCDSSVGVCLENKDTANLPVTSTDAANDPVHVIDIDASPGNELSAFRANTFKNDGDNSLSPPGGNQTQAERKEATHVQDAPVAEPASAKQDINLQLQDGSGHIASEIMPGSPKPGELSEPRQENPKRDPARTGKTREGLNSGSLKSSNGKFCIKVPPPDQTWLEFPCRLPVLPRRKKQGRKVVVLEDPRARRWPVLYLCTPSFSGFVTGWADVRVENGLREGDTCELELRGSNSELALRVPVPVATVALRDGQK